MRVRYYLIALLLAAAGWGIGSVLIPRGGELALVYYKAGRYEAARKILEKELTDGAPTPTNIHYAAKTYLRLGETDRASALIERYVRSHPDDVAGRRMLGRLYKEAGKPALFLQNLEQIERLAPSAKTRILLKELYYEQGLYKRWASMLKKVVDDGDGSPDDYFNLAQLMAAQGKKKEAVRYLPALRGRAPQSFGQRQVALFAILEIDLDRQTSALEAVRHYLAPKLEPSDALYFADLFQRRGHVDAALDILLPYADQAATNDELLSSLTALEISAGRAARALKRLRELDEHNKLKPSQFNLLITAALAARDWSVAKQAFARADVARLKQDVILQIVNEASSREDVNFGRLIDSRLTDAFKRANPVSAARVALLIGDRPAAERWADFADSGKALTNEERLNLIAIFVALHETGRAEKHLRAVAKGGAVPDYQLIRLATLMRKFGMTAEGERLFERLSTTRSSPWLVAGRLILTAKKNGPAPSLAWLDKLGTTGKGPRDLTVAIYGAAMEAKLFNLAVAAADRLVALDNNRQNRIWQARALALSGNATRAFALLRPLLKTSLEARQIYAEAVLGALKAGSMQPREAQAFLRGYLRDSRIGIQQRKFMVYDLVALKAYDIILPVVRELAAKDPKTFTLLYLEALVQAKDKRAFAKAIVPAIDRARGIEELRQLGKLAFQESLQPAAKKAYLKVQALRPDDPEALKHLGLIAFYSNDNNTARRLLTRYLATGANDYQADYALGEVINKFADWRSATPYFRRALAKISKLKSPTVDDLKIKAHLLYRNGRFADAIKTYERLLRLRPRDAKLRNQYIDFLIEIGRYGRARQLQQRS
ncbi:MAG: tetratricopeptide repeat protein [Bauldia litoralis]